MHFVDLLCEMSRKMGKQVIFHTFSHYIEIWQKWAVFLIFQHILPNKSTKCIKYHLIIII